MSRICLLFCSCLCLVVASSQVTGARQQAPGEVLVLLWFDTEDYRLPASDDAAKRVAEIRSARGIRATFKIVGEKARVLERGGRTDVIAALKRHDIGYHSNLHSVHPTPAEYLAESGWSEGVSEFTRRDSRGEPIRPERSGRSRRSGRPPRPKLRSEASKRTSTSCVRCPEYAS